MSNSLDCTTQWTVAYQAPLSMGFSRKEYCSGLPFPSPGDLPHPGLPHCRQMLYHLSHQGSHLRWKWLSHVWLFAPHGLYNPWNSPGQNTGVDSLSLLQGSSQTKDQTQVSCIWYCIKPTSFLMWLVSSFFKCYFLSIHSFYYFSKSSFSCLRILLPPGSVLYTTQ